MYLRNVLQVLGSNSNLGTCKEASFALVISHKISLYIWASQMVLVVKNIPLTMHETWVQSLCQEDPLEESMAIHSGILARRVPWTEESGGLQSTGPESNTTKVT